MKITYIQNCRMPTEKAHGYQIAKTCEAFGDAGADTELIIPLRKNPITTDIFEYYNIKTNFTVKYLKFIDFLELPLLPKKVGFILNALEYLVILLFIDIDDQKRVFTRNPEIAWLFKLRGFESYFECHQLPQKKSFLFNFFIKKISGIVTISNGLKKDLEGNYNFPASKIHNAPDGVDFDTFNITLSRSEAREKLKLDNEQKIVLYTGHLFEWKGVNTLAQASMKLEMGISVYTIGGNDEEIKQFNERNPGNNVVNIKSVPRELVAVWLKAADILILPNTAKQAISAKYTSPLKLFEYLASGTPIIASNLDSIREILNEDNAILFKPDDSSDLLDKIASFFTKDTSAINSPSSNIALAQKFTWLNRAKQIINFLNNGAN